MTVLLAAAGARAEEHPCEPLAPLGAEARPGESDVYVAVGEAEEARGELGTAARAYREALRHDPGHVRARSRFDALCETLRDAPPPRPRWSLLAVAELEVDSNVALLPTDAPPASMLGDPEADGALALLVQALFRPRRELVLGLGASVRKQLRLEEFDRLSGVARANLGLGIVQLGYAFGVESLGGELANIRQDGLLAIQAGRFRAAYRLVGRLDQLDETRGFRGTEHQLAAGVTLGGGFFVEAIGESAQTAEPLFRHVEVAARVVWRRPVLRRVSLDADVRLGWARYDEVDIDGERRNDLRAELTILAEVELDRRLSLLFGAEAALSSSTVEDFSFSQVVASAGVAWAWEHP
jgi:hypothetical protein